MSLNVLQVIERAFRIHGTLAAQASPTAADAAMGLVAFNALKRSWFGTLIGPRLGPLSLSVTPGQAENGGEYQIPGGAAFTVTAPLNPKSGARFGVVDAALAWTTYPLTVQPNGRLMQGSAANTTISTAGQNTRWWFRGDTGNWIVEADFATLTSAIEFPDPVIAYMPYMLAVAIAAELGADVRQEVAFAAGEGRAVLARAYGRRGRAQPEGPLGLAAAAPAPAQPGPQG
jgi:hypothetical protein